MTQSGSPAVTVTFAGSGDAFGSGGRYQACIHLRPGCVANSTVANSTVANTTVANTTVANTTVANTRNSPVLLDCGATSLSALRRLGLDPGEIAAVVISHLHGDHFGGLPFLILDAQFSHRTEPLAVAGPPGTARRLAEAMECLFPGSSQVRRRFEVAVTELSPGMSGQAGGVGVRAWAADHPSGAPALLLRLEVAGQTIAYTGDTAWTAALAEVAADADLLIAEAYTRDKDIPFHLRLADLQAHRDRLTARRVILTHMSADMLASQDDAGFEYARDGLIVSL